MSWDEVAGILGAEPPLEKRFEQVSGLRKHGHSGGERGDRKRSRETGCPCDDKSCSNCGCRASESSRPGLLGAYLRHELCAANRPSEKIRHGVGAPYNRKQKNDGEEAEFRVGAKDNRHDSNRPAIGNAGGKPYPALRRGQRRGTNRPYGEPRQGSQDIAASCKHNCNCEKCRARRHDDAPMRIRYKASPFPERSNTRGSPKHGKRPASEICRRKRERHQDQCRAHAQDKLTAAKPRDARRIYRTHACHGSRSGTCNQTTEAALAPAILGNGAFERGAIKIRPIGRNKHQFAIRRLPKQKIGEPLLAAGPDDQVGIGQIGCIEIVCKLVGSDRAERKISGSDTAAARRCAARAISCRAP